MGSCLAQIDLGVRHLKKLGGCTMSDEFDRLHGIEKAAVESVLNRSRVLAAKIANELRNKRPEHFGDKLSLADIHASLEYAAGVLEQKCLDGRSNNTSTPTVTRQQLMR